MVGRAFQKGSGSAETASSLQRKSFDQRSSTVLRSLGLEAGAVPLDEGACVFPSPGLRVECDTRAVGIVQLCLFFFAV